MQGPPGYPPHIHPTFQQTLAPPGHHIAPRPPSGQEVRTPQPLPHDLSSSQALATNFGVSPDIVGDLKLAPAAFDTEDLAVGSSGLASHRDRDIDEPSLPRDAAKWTSVTIHRNSASSPTVPLLSANTASTPFSDVVWLPKDRGMVRTIVEIYFSRLNVHRPVFTRSSFEPTLHALYSGDTPQHDPGFVCSVYLILALGTLSHLNHRINGLEKEGQVAPTGSTALQKVMPPDWPTPNEFFKRALAVKPDLRVTISSLQALILLHWYLYTERQGRTLWRLVGSLVRLSIELGLHHDPSARPSEDNPAAIPFSNEECQLRVRLWAIVLVHDRGTSILLGRPLAISPSDSNTPRPSRANGPEVSEHYVLSAPIAEIQADIINSLYAPTRQTEDSIMRHATRIIKSMVEFRRQLPESYRCFFSGTDDWTAEKRTKLVQDITEDQGLTLLKIGITRILLLRAIFNSKELDFKERHRALVDAIVTSHNIIVVHNQLIKFPDIAFFVSPIPLHIAAMVILYGHMSKCERLPLHIALEDVWMALDMLPSFRWRWERKDLNGGHPLIATLAESVLKVNLHQVSPTTAPMLLSETDWETEGGVLSPKPLSGPHPGTPTMGPAQYSPVPYVAQPPNSNQGGKGSPTKGVINVMQAPADKKLAEVPAGLFYPFYPETPANASTTSTLLNANQPMGNYGYQPSQDSFMLEEKDPSIQPSGMPVWPIGHHDPRMMAPYQMPS
ncbi:hypothetical protein EW026_g2403 [Hermanssonia centrifuga]|uniref:Xylanolytic transcriptional activator regulatory domain-containing protein n=1 Tax=Hermanssonia centrifuga TaxID=98765 RepID=A0A4V3XB02_9APHY|nr:hypothetical protein EW026_g2403 [Hermanssonia centrifuga]